MTPDRVAGHERLKVPADLMEAVRRQAARAAVDPQQLLEALIASGGDAEADAGREEATALRLGQARSASELAGLVASSSALPIMTLRLGPWMDEPISTPFARAGYGSWANAGPMDLVPSIRGFWRAKNRGDRRMLAFRRGVPVGHYWAGDWQAFQTAALSGRIVTRWWARQVWVVESGVWVHADTGARSPLGAVDQAVERALNGIVVAWPAGNRNPVGWL